MALNITNFLRTSLRAPIAPTDTVLPLAVGTGVLFNLPVGDYMYLTLEDRLVTEIVRYTSTGPVVGDNLVVVRAQDNTTAKAFPAGTCVKVAWNEAQITELMVQVASTTCSPKNTVLVTTAPTIAPTGCVIYAVNVSTSPATMYYWNGVSWTVVGSSYTGVPPIRVNALTREISLAIAAGSGLSVNPAGELTYTPTAVTPVSRVMTAAITPVSVQSGSGATLNVSFSGLTPNQSSNEVLGIGSLQGYTSNSGTTIPYLLTTNSLGQGNATFNLTASTPGVGSVIMTSSGTLTAGLTAVANGTITAIPVTPVPRLMTAAIAPVSVQFGSGATLNVSFSGLTPNQSSTEFFAIGFLQGYTSDLGTPIPYLLVTNSLGQGSAAFNLTASVPGVGSVIMTSSGTLTAGLSAVANGTITPIPVGVGGDPDPVDPVGADPVGADPVGADPVGI